MKMSAFPATPEWKKHGSWPPMWRRRHQVNNKSHDTCTPYSCSKKNLGSGKDKDKLRWLLRTHYVWEMEMDENRTVGDDLKKKKTRFSLSLPDQKPNKTNINSGQAGNFKVPVFSSHSPDEELSPLEVPLLWVMRVMTVEVNTLNN